MKSVVSRIKQKLKCKCSCKSDCTDMENSPIRMQSAFDIISTNYGVQDTAPRVENPSWNTREAMNSSSSNDPGDGSGGVSNQETNIDNISHDRKYSVEPDDEVHQTVSFGPSHNGVSLDMGASVDYFRHKGVDSIELNKFLGRPIKIADISWAVGSSLATDIKPWHLFFNNSTIKNKITNYFLLKCNLKVKIVLNASMFYYGAGLVSYQPLLEYTMPALVGSAGEIHRAKSQRPNIHIYPQTSSGGELTLPFLCDKEWLNITKADDLLNMGELNFDSYTTLQVASAGATADITIAVYAWAEDIILSGATTRAAMQGKNEYAMDGPISKPASAIARYTGLLSKAPVIGPYATATSMISSGVANIASLFGYSNPPVINDVQPVKLKSHPNFANTEICEPVESLTLDSKNELTLDQKVLGIANSQDDLRITNFAQRKSFITSSTWASSDAVGTTLGRFKVNPCYASRNTTTTIGNAKVISTTPSGYISEMFEYWRGDMIFSFKFVCSGTHVGRVKIQWDPSIDLGSGGARDDSTTITKICDLSESTEFEMRIPYEQAKAYLRCERIGNFIPYGIGSLAIDNEYDNGALLMTVLNRQSSALSTANITVLSFIRCAENIEFAVPRQIQRKLTFFAPQSALDNDHVSQVDPAINLVYFGEAVDNLRTLMRRTNFEGYYSVKTSTPIFATVDISLNKRRTPVPPGVFAYGTSSCAPYAAGPGVVDRANLTCWNPMSYLSPCFKGQKGSIVWTVNSTGNNLNTELSIVRLDEDTSVSGTTGDIRQDALGDNIHGSAYDNAARLAQRAYISEISNCGLSLTNPRTQEGLSVSLPLYSTRKFVSTDPNYATDGYSATRAEVKDGTHRDGFRISAETYNDSPRFNFKLYCRAGSDYDLVFFMNTPILYLPSTEIQLGSTDITPGTFYF